MLKFMLDTNIVIYVIKRRPIEVLEVFNRYETVDPDSWTLEYQS